jgi:hypothetical protein
MDGFQELRAQFKSLDFARFLLGLRIPKWRPIEQWYVSEIRHQGVVVSMSNMLVVVCMSNMLVGVYEYSERSDA